ncbi:Drug/Metabolite Transporter (DMT) Superfamily [Achlya hypogyna]|uniref:Drug/Metabolite Transporter (DMT) Superfamily n=1 Tax=Achlya hypogyna TaxID=1202772 RepID=A0A1V9Y969_ACHHY|nr:Drug/Metabolite Transporter (DMT) Superfamily [Achlya hypogyna]
MSCGKSSAILFTLGVITSVPAIILVKSMYDVEVTVDGRSFRFERPLFCVWLMFLSMVLAFPLHLFFQNGRQLTRRGVLLAAIPSAFAMVEMFFGYLALLYIPASVDTMIIGSQIAFVALFKRLFLNHTIHSYEWVGVLLNMTAACLVGVSSILGSPHAASAHPLLGVGFSFLSCIVSAMQGVVEEHLLVDPTVEIPPMAFVGVQGIWGLLFTTLLAYPLAYVVPGSDAGSFERLDVTFQVVATNTTVQWLVLGQLVCLLLMNVFRMLVIFVLDALWVSIMNNFRTGGVWAVDLVLYHGITHGAFGEAWTPWSWLELAGMFVLFIGTAVHDGQFHKHAAIESIDVPKTPTAESNVDYATLPEKAV